MNTVRSGSSLLLFAIVLAASSCGGSSDGDDTPPPSGGSGGSPSAGGMATAGTVNGTSGASSGGTAAGGMSATAGSGGSTAGTGAGGMPGKGSFGCPGEKPQEASECTRMIPGACTYDDGGCVCVDGAWDCYSDADCPASAPEDAATCTLGGMACAYDDGLNCNCSAMNGWSCSTPCPEAPPASDATCRRPATSTCRYADGAIVQGGFGKADTTCACEEGTFSCFSQEDCPAAAPENASACTFATLACPYDDRQCTCTDDAWSCVTECPEAVPSDGAQCLRPAGANCRYLEGAVVEGFGGKSDTTCACDEGAFNCFGQEDCPTAAPANDEACEFQTLSCSYEGAQCNCGESGWSCTTECPAAVPAQDSACSRPEQATCRYDEGMLVQGFGAAEAVCACREEKFDCLTQADCPATAPASEAECMGLSGLACAYDGQQCTCGQNGWTCQTECPAAPPTAGATCTRPVTSACLYTGGALVEAGMDAENTCVCADGAFTCYSAADCPATAPTGACDKPGLECTFADQDCRCRTSTGMWSCMMSQAPGAGGAGG